MRTDLYVSESYRERDMLCLLLDVRNVNSGLLDKDALSDAYHLLQTSYVGFVKRASTFQYDKKVKQWRQEKEKIIQQKGVQCADDNAKLPKTNPKLYADDVITVESSIKGSTLPANLCRGLPWG